MKQVTFPGWRNMTGSQRYNAKMELIFQRAKETQPEWHNQQKDNSNHNCSKCEIINPQDND